MIGCCWQQHRLRGIWCRKGTSNCMDDIYIMRLGPNSCQGVRYDTAEKVWGGQLSVQSRLWKLASFRQMTGGWIGAGSTTTCLKTQGYHNQARVVHVRLHLKVESRVQGSGGQASGNVMDMEL